MKIVLACVLLTLLLSAVLSQDGTPIASGTTQQGTVDPGAYRFFSYTTGEGYQVEFVLTIQTGDADVFVSDNPAERPSKSSGAHSSVGRETGSTKRVVMSIPPNAANMVFNIGVLGTASTSSQFSLTVNTIPFADPVALSAGSPVTVNTPVLRSFVFNAKAGTDVNFTISSTGSSADFFADTNFKWPSFMNYRYLRHITDGAVQNVLIPVSQDGPIYVSLRSLSSSGAARMTVSSASVSPAALADGGSVTGTLAQGQHLFYSYTPGSGSASELTLSSGDADVFVSHATHERPTAHSHMWRAIGTDKSVVLPLPDGQTNTFTVAVVGRTGGSFTLGAKTHTRAVPTPMTDGQTLQNKHNNSMAAYFSFVSTRDDVDLNVTVTADDVSGAEFFSDGEEQFPSFSRYAHYTFVPAGRSVSTLLCMHKAGSMYFALRPVAVGSVPSIHVKVVSHPVTPVVAGTPATGTIAKDAYKFFSYTPSDAIAVEFVLSATSGSADLFVSDNPSVRPVDGAAGHSTVGSEAPESHKNLVLQLPAYGGADKPLFAGVRGNSDGTSFSLTVNPQPFKAPVALTVGTNFTTTDTHTMPQFFSFVADSPDADLNVTVYSSSPRGTHFFASTDYQYPSFQRYQWFRHVQADTASSIIICSHGGQPVYAAVRPLSHGAVASILVQRASHKIGVMDGVTHA